MRCTGSPGAVPVLLVGLLCAFSAGVATALQPLSTESRRRLHHEAERGCPEYEPQESERKVTFMLLGQQKSGTSSMWNILTKHPKVATAGHRKENFFWATGGSLHEHLRWDACLWPLSAYMQFLANDNAFRRMCPGEILGDFTATHFSCPCCPERFHSINPDLKLIVMLREPRSRAKSRYREQQKLENLYLKQSFEKVVYNEIDWMKSSHCHANRFLRDQPELGPLPELFCSAQSNIAGWSNYPAFLRNWLEHFSSEQLLVLYTEQFDKDPQMSLKAVHDFLGVEDFEYPEEVMGSTHFNTGSCGYGWNDKCRNEAPGNENPQNFAGENHQNLSMVVHDLPKPNFNSRSADAFFDTVVKGMFDLAADFRIPIPPKSWLDDDRMQRLNLTSTDYLRVHTKQVSVYQHRATMRVKSKASRISMRSHHGVSQSLVDLVQHADSA